MAKSNSEFKSIQKKLVAAVAMVLVASIMVVSSSYAWFTLSTAPEVTGIQTAVGSNGNLEMALREDADLNKITSGIGQQFPEANNFWGNLVDLSHSSYHMDAIALAPARLNATLDTSKTQTTPATYSDVYAATDTAYVVGGKYNGEEITAVEVVANPTPSNPADPAKAYVYKITTKSVVKPVYMLNGGAGAPYLQTPVYGADGRVSDLDAANVINGTYDENAKGFTAKDNIFGVRAVGTSSSMTPEELALRSAKQAVSSAISNAKTSASASLRDDSVKLASIIIDYKLDSSTTYDKDDVANIRVAVNSLNAIADELENALYQAVIAVGVSQGLDIKTPDEGGTITIGADAITATDNVKSQSIDWTNLKDMQAVICAANVTLTSLKTDLGAATTALDSDELKADSGIEFDDISVPLNKLIKTSDIRIVDSATGTSYTVDGFMDVFDANPLTAGKILMTTPTISLVDGIYAYIAKFAGNFSATTSMVVSGEYGSLKLDNETVSVVMATSVSEPKATYTVPNEETTDVTDDTITLEVNGYYLSVLLNQLSAVKPSGTQSNAATVITDVYGYAVDMAFRTNAKGSSLLLQTAPANRVSDESGDITQGGGSYMQFTAGNAEFELYQVVNLMKTIRVVFMNDAGNIFGVATLDVEVTNVQAQAKDENGDLKVDTEGKPVMENVKFVAGTKDHDFADANGDALTLSAGELVVIDGKQYIKAYLQMTGFTVSADGAMTIGEKLDSSVITDLQQNVPTAVTTLVYMDGDDVENSDVAISGKSMTGTMNLQFASNAELDPMDYTYGNEQVNAPTSATIGANGYLTIVNNTADDKGATGYEVYYEGKLIGSVKAAETGDTSLNLNAYLERLPVGNYKFELVGTRDNLLDSDAVVVEYTKTAPAETPDDGGGEGGGAQGD